MNYFVVGIGRSGTTWLSQVLDSAPGWTCGHEPVDPRSKVIPYAHSPFPLERFLARGEQYGECHGMLRYHLSVGDIGPEMAIMRRVYLRRHPLDIVASWMCGGNRTADELSATCHEVFWQANNLRRWAAMTCSRIVDAETLWSDRAELQELVDWLGLPLTVAAEHMHPVNALPPDRRDVFEWTPDRIALARKTAARVGLPTAALTQPS